MGSLGDESLGTVRVLYLSGLLDLGVGIMIGQANKKVPPFRDRVNYNETRLERV